MNLTVVGKWDGWVDVHQQVKLSDGTVWRQDDTHYEPMIAYSPEVELIDVRTPFPKMRIGYSRKFVRVSRVR